MLCVVDVNIVYSSLLTKGNSFNVFVLNDIFNKFEFIAPEYLFDELDRHKQEITKRADLTELEFDEVFDFIKEQTTFVPNSQFEDFLPRAEEILKLHKKDSQYLALALKFNCIIFSGDKELKKFCPDIVKNPREMLDLFYKL